MLAKTLTALITVAAGIGAALLLFWVLNWISERLPGSWEDKVKPYLYILPAFAAIVVYLVYPAVLTVINSFKDNFSRNWVGVANYRSLFGSHAFRETLFNTLLWILIVPAACVVVGLAVAVLADRLGPRGEKTAKTVIFLPMAISLVGAATVWRFIYDAEPKGSDADRPPERHWQHLPQGPRGMAGAE